MREPNAEAQSQQRDARNLPFPLSILMNGHIHMPGSTEFIGESNQVSTSPTPSRKIETHHLGDHEPRRRAGRSGGLVAAAAARIYVDVHRVAAVGGGHVSLLRRWWLVFHLHLACWCWVVVLVALFGNEKNDCLSFWQVRNSYSGYGFGMWQKASATHKLICTYFSVLTCDKYSVFTVCASACLR